MLVNIFLLFLVLIPGIGTKVNGARRWIFGFQPTEMAKLSAIIYLSSWFITKERKRFYSFIILLGLLMFLIILQPDMGTAVIIFLLSIIIYFLAGIELHYLLLLVPFSGISFYLLAKSSPYRVKRLLAFLILKPILWESPTISIRFLSPFQTEACLAKVLDLQNKNICICLRHILIPSLPSLEKKWGS